MIKTIKKIALLLAITLLTTLLWFAGMETIYARLLAFSANTALTITGRESNIKVEKENNTAYFLVHTRVDGRRANYPQNFETLLLPAVMIIAWQVFSLLYRSRNQSLRSAATTIGIFLLLQVIFLLLLTAYYSSGLAKYLYDVLMDTFYVVALILIIIDYVRYPVFQNSISVIKKKPLP